MSNQTPTAADPDPTPDASGAVPGSPPDAAPEVSREVRPGAARTWSQRGLVLPAAVLAAAVVVAAVVGFAVTRHRPSSSDAVAAWGWGSDQFGQLGPVLPAAVTGETHPVSVPSGTTQMVAGVDFVLALAGHTVYAWGRNDHGELADGTTTDRATPAPIDLPPVSFLAADDHHALAVTTDGAVYAWGGNADGELGDGTTVERHRPVRVSIPGGAAVHSVATGTSFSLAVTTDGAVWAWGANGSGQLGTGATTSATRPARTRLPSGARVAAVAAGAAHAIARTDHGALLVWGADNRGQLGVGASSSVALPTALRLPGSAKVTQVAAGLGHSEALRADGTVWAWGADDLGQLDGVPGPDRPTPRKVPIPGGSSVRDISLTSNRTVAVTSGDRVVAWGATPFGVRADAGSGQDAAAVRTIALGTRSTPLSAVVGGEFALVLVRAGAPASVIAATPRYLTRSGHPVTLAASVLDADGNRLDRTVTATVAGGSCNALVCTVRSTGMHRVTLSAGSATAHTTILVVGR